MKAAWLTFKSSAGRNWRGSCRIRKERAFQAELERSALWNTLLNWLQWKQYYQLPTVAQGEIDTKVAALWKTTSFRPNLKYIQCCEFLIKVQHTIYVSVYLQLQWKLKPNYIDSDALSVSRSGCFTFHCLISRAIQWWWRQRSQYPHTESKFGRLLALLINQEQNNLHTGNIVSEAGRISLVARSSHRVLWSKM